MIPVKSTAFISFLMFQGKLHKEAKWGLSQNFNSGKFTYAKTHCLV